MEDKAWKEVEHLSKRDPKRCFNDIRDIDVFICKVLMDLKNQIDSLKGSDNAKPD